jgi:glycosyltransferase involved in cell wall biosynthesis
MKKTISLLNWPNGAINLKHSGGLDVVEFYQLKELNKYYDANLYAKKIIGKQNNMKVIKSVNINFLSSYDLYYYYNFYQETKNSWVIIGYNAPLICLFRQKNTFIYYHNVLRFLGKYGVKFLPFYKLFMNKYNQCKYIFVSNYVKNQFVKKYPNVPHKNLFVLLNFVDNSCIKKRTRFYKETDVKKIIFAGVWNQLKGFDELINAVVNLRKKRTDFELHLIGGFDLWEKTRKKIEIPPVDYIKVIGKKTHEDCLKYMHNMDIIVVPSKWAEPFGLVAIEGLANQLITIISDRGGLAEIIDEGVNGFKFSYEHKPSLIEVINKVLDLSPTSQKHIRNNGLKKVESLYTLNNNITLLRRIIEANSKDD